MNKRRFSTIVLILLLAIDAIGQNNREQVFIHLNSQVVLAGESILLSAYCRSQLTGKSSTLSKVLYVEIIGTSGPILQEKLKLDEGRGSSDFFISSTVPTGKYYLVAYTRWMKNFDEYFRSQIEIINPFEPAPSIDPENGELQVKFFIDNAQPVAGLNNILGFKVNNLLNKATPYEGKIVSSTGETITNFEHDSFGIGSFKYTPEKGETYKMILEDTLGNINFFDVPMAREIGTTINLEYSNKVLLVELQSKGVRQNTAKLRLYNESMRLTKQLVGLNSNISFDLSKVHGELFRVELLDSDESVYISKNLYQPGKTGRSNVRVDDTYSTRSMVDLSMALEPGSYSISVRKKNNYLSNRHTRAIASRFLPVVKDAPVDISEYLSHPGPVNMEAFLLGTTIHKEALTSELRFLPEFRNEFLDGRLLSEENEPVANEILMLTVFNEPSTILTAKTDSTGNFSIPFESLYVDTEAVITPVKLDSTFSVELSSPFILSEENFDFAMQPFDSNQVMEVIAKSIRTQIENAYYTADTTTRSLSYLPAQIDYNKTYVLDDYTRFNTLKETFIEYIPEANVRENRIPKLKPYITAVPENLQKPPLILLDGVPVSDKSILQFSTSNIERIEILNSRYFLGPLVSDGIINFTTFDGKMGRFNRANYHQFTTISGLTKGSPFKSTSHNSTSLSKLPDQRDQLYWNSQLLIEEEGRHELIFYTSDVAGVFEIVIEGFQDNGVPVSVLKTFEVINRPRP